MASREPLTLASRLAAGVLIAVPGAILGTALAATLAMGSGAPGWLRIPFRLFCHGIADRCLSFGGVPMPVCARCSGIYAGLIVAAVAFAAISRLRSAVLPVRVLVLALVPLALDGLSQAAGFRESTNGLRLATGFLAGAAFVQWILSRIEAHARTAGDGGRADAIS